METNSKVFPKKNRKVGLVCIIIILSFIVISRFKIVDIGSNKLFIFWKLDKTGCLLNPVTIKTEIGTIYLGKFEKVYPKAMGFYGIIYFLWYELMVEGEEIEYDLTLFGEKIKNVESILLDNRNYFTIFISPQYFNLLDTIDRIENGPVGLIRYDPRKRIVVLPGVKYQSSDYIEMTLDGDILDTQ